MPTPPMGGLTLIVNIAILIVGSLVLQIVRRGYALKPFFRFLNHLISRQTDTAARRFLSWSMAASVLVVVAGGMVSIVGASLVHETNFSLLAQMLESRRALAQEPAAAVGTTPHRETPVLVPGFLSFLSTTSLLVASSTVEEEAIGRAQ